MSSLAVDFIRDFRLQDAPPEVVRHARRLALDLIGVAAAGSRLPASRIMRDVAAPQFGGGQARFFFDGRAASAAGAAEMVMTAEALPSLKPLIDELTRPVAEPASSRRAVE